MTTTELLKLRLHNQLLAGSKLGTPEEIVNHMGAIQAQNYEMAKWGIGIRLHGSTNAAIEASINRGEIIRTHILRPTWHFVTAADIHWMLELTAPHIKKALAASAKTRGFENEVINKGCQLLPIILEEHGHLTRQEIHDRLTAEGVRLNDKFCVNYIVFWSELEGVVCNGIPREGKQTYALLHQRAPKNCSLSREEALERLARRYFNSHGPAGIQDFVWWSGLSTTEARRGIKAIEHDFIRESMNGKEYWMPNSLQSLPENDQNTLLLPAFDEFVVSYRDRSEIISETYYRKVLTRTGSFSPTIHLNGEVVGTWARVPKKNKVEAKLSFFETTPKKVHSWFKEQVKQYEDFQ